jgi:hypothetical protein
MRQQSGAGDAEKWAAWRPTEKKIWNHRVTKKHTQIAGASTASYYSKNEADPG